MLLGVLRNWAWLQRTQWMNRNELERIQTERLRETVIHAYQKVPFYNELYEAAHVPINSIWQANDISKLPVTTSIDFRRAPIEMRTALDAKVSSCIIHTTSGTTGVPVSTLEDPYAAAYREALMLRFLWTYGVRPQDKMARGRYMSASTYPKRLAETGGWGMLRRKVLGQRFFTTFGDQFKFLVEFKPDVLLANSSFCKALARHCKETERKLQFRMVVTWGELLDASTRNLIQDTFQSEVFDQYGLEEVGGSIAWECPTHSGYHINAESLMLEFLHNGAPVPAGEAGEMHVTCFHRMATPIVRYFTGDVATIVDDNCPCGRGLPLMREIQGRVTDYILTPAGRHVSPHQIMGVLANTPGVAQYKVTQKEDFSIEVSVVTDRNEVKQVIKDVEVRCMELFDETPLDVKLVDNIAVTSGKSRVVESRITG